jgi:hypothetical protein
MRRFLTRILLYFLALFTLVSVALYLSSAIVEKRGFQIYEAESNLFFIHNKEHFDLVILGISHARNFSRSKNHIRLERNLGLEITNFGLGEGRCGVNEQDYYLRYFYRRNNTADKVIYVISPPMFFSKELPVASNTFDREPFRLDFFLPYLFYPSQNKGERLLSYVRSKFSDDWYVYKPWSLNEKVDSLSGINWDVVRNGEKLVYGDSLDMEPFDISTKRVEKTIDLALKNNSEVVLMVMPALFGKWMGHEEVDRFAKEMAKKDGVEYYDFSTSIKDPSLYYDHHHLNSKGMDYFVNEYLLELLTE